MDKFSSGGFSGLDRPMSQDTQVFGDLEEDTKGRGIYDAKKGVAVD
jgi:hypothetical protein